MSYIKLTPEQKAEIVADAARGKTTAEIIDGLKERHKLTIKAAKIYATLKAAGVPPKKWRQKGTIGDREPRALTATGAQLADNHFINLVERLDRANEAIFKYLRLNLIKKLAEKHEAMREKKIQIPEGDELTPAETLLIE